MLLENNEYYIIGLINLLIVFSHILSDIFDNFPPFIL